MDTLSLIDLHHIEIKEETDSLYYDQYQYCLKLRMSAFSCLRKMHRTTATQWDVADGITKRYANLVRWSRSGSFFAPISGEPPLNSEDKRHLDNLTDLLDFLWPFKENIKPVFSGNWGYVYANSKPLLQQIARKHYVHAYYIKEAVITHPKNTVRLTNPTHKFRSFLKECELDLEQKNNLLDYLSRIEDICISESLLKWLKDNHAWSWTRRYYFFDHNDPKIELMLHLIMPGIIRQTWPIIAK